ncbi:MAG: putative lipid II flippase FtsW [Actinobacteria bacterium]|uniref:peptidoglycan glycosyltransferase n=1 Tax=freshwater metagenome TaxID=449393 RepID=A0A6J6FQG7_9ZZZZ|nr:putative lipid II flippase FtsW [Actinomycetota bacterium]
MTKAGQKFLAKPVNNFYILAVSALSLSVIGLVMVFSASSIHSLDTKGNAVGIVLRQFAFFVISIPLAAFLSQRTLLQWRLLARFGLLLSTVILLALQIPGVGKTVNGNTNWIALPFVDVQPSELAKFFLILWAGYMLSNQERAGKSRINVFALIGPGFALVMLLVMLGHDLGTTCVIAAILGGMLFVSGIELRIFGSIIAVGAIAFAALIVTASYRLDRFLVVLDPFAAEDYKNAGWQPAHSLLGLATGGIFGVGLGGSRQKWGNLAEAHTDFIFAVIGEELGLLGTLAVLLLLAALIYSIFKIALRCKDPMSRYVGAGIGCWIAIQTILNVGSATSVLPVVGVTLPFVSYGGSALISLYIALGYVFGSALRDPEVKDELQKAIERRRLRTS